MKVRRHGVFLKIFSVIIIQISLLLIPSNSVAASKNNKAKRTHAKKSRIVTKEHSDDYLDGIASCYARKFVGRKTTSGDIFRMDRYTGAHPTLPMRTKLKVTNNRTGKIVYIEVNDRMGKASGHVIDLTKLAGNKIGICPYGITNVKLEVLDNDLYNSMLNGHVGRGIIGASSLLSIDQKLEIANQMDDLTQNESEELYKLDKEE